MLVALYLLVVEHFCREQDYGDMACGRVLLQCRTELHSVHLRHHHVAHHDVGDVFDCHFQSFLSVGALHDVVFVGEGGNLINLVQKMNPSWNNHEVLTYLEQKIKEHHLQYSEDYEAQRKEDERKEAWKQDQAAQREKAKEANTIIERIVGLSHPYLRDYILQRRIDYDIAKEYCKEVHYRIYDKSYYAIAFENIEGGMEARNKYSKRSIGKKSISIIKPNNEPHKECCIFEGFFDMLTYASIKKWITGNELCLPHECDYLVLNSVSNIKVLLPYLQEYSVIHCYLDNDDAGAKTVEKIKVAYQDKVVDESHRYVNYKDVNDVINGIIKPPK